MDILRNLKEFKLMNAQPLTLYSNGLLSKYGFHDGDILDTWIDENEIDLDIEIDSHETLKKLVRLFLVPQLEQTVELSELETCHNPIRARKINGVNVTDEWYEDDHEKLLTPEYVDIPASQVLENLVPESE